MRGFVLLILAAGLGAVASYGALRWFGGGEVEDGGLARGELGSGGTASGETVAGQAGQSVPAEASRGEPAPKGPALAAKPRFFEGDPDPGQPEPGRGDPGGVGGVRVASPGVGAPAPSVPPPSQAPPIQPGRDPADVAGGTPTTAIAPRVAEDLRLAEVAFRSGERERGIRILRQVYAVEKDNAVLDLASQVAILYRDEKDAARRKEYLEYLIRRDPTGAFFKDQLAECDRKLAIADTGPEEALDAWDALSLAYEVARERSQKEKVIERLRPFVDRMVLSGRYSPCLESYNVQTGDTLSSIAAKFQTTVDSLRRLNNLASDTIQPRQRLRVLPGKVEVFVDKSDFVLWATVDGRVLCEFSVGLGKDNSTPLGTFVVDLRQKDPTWWRPGQPSLPPGDPQNILGTRWIGFKETPELAGYGIHGTNDPASLGKESSAGCVRLKKEDVELLFDFVGFGTVVEIRP